MTAEVATRQTLPVTPLDPPIVAALDAAAAATGEPYLRMHSGAAHDTMCVADRVPSAMVFVPCATGSATTRTRRPTRPTRRSRRRSSSTRFGRSV